MIIINRILRYAHCLYRFPSPYLQLNLIIIGTPFGELSQSDGQIRAGLVIEIPESQGHIGMGEGTSPFLARHLDHVLLGLGSLQPLQYGHQLSDRDQRCVP
ncbi:hypothetical protein I3842_13G055900 [Carya illinoinensis]|uniref:Uncharacterized protein n=1 Tax=Carya illinoinensis TaxID=32201 RepID=A0A922AM49_CARIL|nr:hypothetical protein I3842_13G055900 [Carya illinoinensis]